MVYIIEPYVPYIVLVMHYHTIMIFTPSVILGPYLPTSRYIIQPHLLSLSCTASIKSYHQIITRMDTATKAECYKKISEFQKQLKCGLCSNILNLQEHELEFELVSGGNGGVVKIIHKECPGIAGGEESRGNPGFIHCCLECEATSSSPKPSQVRCRCCKPKASTEAATNTNADDASIYDCGDMNFDPDPDPDPDPNLDPSLDQERLQYLEGQKVEDYFTKNFPKHSAKYFSREHRKRFDGRKGLITNALVHKDIDSNFDVSEEETHYHLHLTSMFHGLHQSKLHDIASTNEHMVREGVRQEKTMADMLKKCFEESFREVMETTGMDINGGLLDQMNVTLDKNIDIARASATPRVTINHPTEYNTIRTNYIEGANSVYQNIPAPEVKDLDGFAYIPLEQIISHIVAFGTEGMLTFKHDSDWTNDKGQYSGTYFKDMHDEVKRMEQTGEITNNTRIHFLRTWSDGFIAFHIKADSEHNNLQLFTLTIMASDGTEYSKKKKLTLPFALGFKKKDHCVITNQLLNEMKEARVARERYCGKEKRLVNMVFFLQLVMADYPERCANTYTAQLGTYTHRWGYSCQFDEESTPSCQACESARIGRVMEGQESEAKKCPLCCD